VSEIISGDSLEIVTNQQGIHQNLHAAVHKHLSTTFEKPYHDDNLVAFESFLRWHQSDKPLFLDSCCGVGESTVHLARGNPSVQVLGCDISTHRLAKVNKQSNNKNNDEALPENMLLLHADIIDIWRLLLAADIRPLQHTILYPNPWPKSKHLQRRWHGSAIFPTIITLGGSLVMRSNWALYLQEFSAALSVANIDSQLTAYAPELAEAITPFEHNSSILINNTNRSIKMFKKIGLVLLGFVLGASAFFGVAIAKMSHFGDHWESGKFSQKIEQKIADKLTLNDTQKAALTKIVAHVEAQRSGMNESFTDTKILLKSQASAEKFDRDAVINSVTARLDDMKQEVPVMVNYTADFMDSLTAEQRTQIAEILEKRHGKRGWGKHHK
jgi:tRNA G46 methylase TrmB/Spy/CpxP family protein refolding chaperone